MYILLLTIIYIAFISLGLPDSLLGSAWPVMQTEFGVPLSYAGIISMIISASTIISSLFADRLTRKLGSGFVTSISVLISAVSLLGFAFFRSFALLAVIAVPYGLSAGAIDAALNNYVALHYKSKHMSWLHCMWGVGATVSPYIMGYAMGTSLGWRGGYGIVSVIQLILAVFMFATLSVWKINSSKEGVSEEGKSVGIIGVLSIRGVKAVLFTFFAYCALEATAGLWAGTFLLNCRGVDERTAAMFSSLFYIGISVGRFVMGFFADLVGDRNMIRLGLGVLSFGLILIIIPTEAVIFSLLGLVIVGLGCAPIYPAIIHSTPENFGADNSQAVIGIQMASAYTGILIMPPLFGAIAENISIALYPYYLGIFAVIMILTSEYVNRTAKNKKK